MSGILLWVIPPSVYSPNTTCELIGLSVFSLGYSVNQIVKDRENKTIVRADDERYRGMLTCHAALFYDPTTFVKVTDIGDLTTLCPHCNALTFQLERKGICCNNGKVTIPSPPSTPELLLQLYSGNHPLSQHFLNNIQQFNGLFKFTSFGANIQLMSDNNGNRAWTPNFKVLGQIYHRLLSL